MIGGAAVNMRSQGAGGARGTSRISPKMVAAVALGVLAIVFIFQNTATGSVSFLFWDIEAPAWLWLTIIFVVGLAVGWVIGRSRAKRKG